MTTRKMGIERFGITSSKPSDAIVAALKAKVGRLDLAEFSKISKSGGPFSELEEMISRDVGQAQLMLFLELDHGAVLQKETGLDKPRMVRFVIGNPFIMKELVKHVPDAGSYAPVTVLVDERSDGVHISYDTMTGYLTPYENSAALKVAVDLDAKVEALLASVVG